MGEPLTTIEARIRRIEDRQALRDLVGRYALAADNMDLGAMAALFTPAARFGTVDGSSLQAGRDAIIEYFRGRFRGPRFHTMNEHLVEWDESDGDRARGLVTGHSEAWSGEELYVAAIRYHDRYVRHDGRWLFDERLLGFLYLVPATDYLRVLGKQDRIKLGDAWTRGNWPATTDE